MRMSMCNLDGPELQQICLWQLMLIFARIYIHYQSRDLDKLQNLTNNNHNNQISMMAQSTLHQPQLEIVNEEAYAELQEVSSCTGETQTKKQSKTNAKQYLFMVYETPRLSPLQRQLLLQEMTTYWRIKSPGLITLEYYLLKQAENGTDTWTLVTKYQASNMLGSLPKDPENRMSEQQILVLLQKLAHVIVSLHERKIAHNRICLSRIMLVEGEPVLGLPYFSTIESIQRLLSPNPQPYESNIYVPPEFFEGFVSGNGGDVWALGMVALQLAFNKVFEQKIPRQNLVKTINVCISGIKNKKLKQLLTRMLQSNRTTRISSSQILSFLSTKDDISEKQEVLETTILSLLDLFPEKIPRDCLDTLPSHDAYLQPIIVSSNVSCFSLGKTKQNGVLALLLEVKPKPFLPAKMAVILKNCHLRSGVRHILPDIAKLAELLKTEKARLCFSDAGVLGIETSDPELMHVIKTKPVVRPPLMERVRRCLAKVTDSNGNQQDGLMIGLGLTLTTARVGSTTMYQMFKIDFQLGEAMRPETITAFERYPITGSQSSSKTLDSFNVLLSDKQIKRRQYITLITNYSEPQTKRKIQASRKNIKFHYQAGAYNTFEPEQLSFKEDSKFCVDSSQSEMAPGCPLLVVFSNNQCYCIGMFLNRTEGYVFEDCFERGMWKALSYCLRRQILLSNQLTTRMLAWTTVDIDRPQSPSYDRSPIFIQNETSADYLLADAPPEHHQKVALLESLLAERNIRGLNNLTSYGYKFDQITNLASQIYGPDCQLLCCEYYTQSCLLRAQGKNSEADAIFSKAFEIIKRYPTNLILYRDCLVMHVSTRISTISSNFLYFNNIDYDQLYRLIVECQQLDSLFETSLLSVQVLNNFGNYYSLLQDNRKVEEYYTKAFKLAKTMPELQPKLISMALNTMLVNKRLGHYTEAVATFKEILEVSSKNGSLNYKQRQAQIMRQWRQLRASINSIKVSPETIEIFISLTKEYILKLQERDATEAITQLSKRKEALK